MMTDKTIYKDYYPNESLDVINNIQNHEGVYRNNKKVKFNLKGNGSFTFTSNRMIDDLSLPFVYYNGIYYQVYLDNKKVKFFHDSNSLMSIKHISKGHHKIKIKVKKNKFEIVSYLLSFIGLVIIVFSILKMRNN
ncbi:hypothetical protein [Apilactobacillus nanyangensis]|uniref:hypothetical protein n=1 Tax=Apilactobacillus nanyangensis TaxID=2799579 RepID=UPI001944DB1E|nr:hypothetical protein [Apilactobacillus nanyangensis]